MTWLRSLVLAAAVAFSLLSVAPTPVQADDYWDGYWGWYDSTYYPSYGRYYTSSRPYYGSPYYAQPYYGGYYGGPYYGQYYGAPRAGVSIYPGGRGAVNVGPVRFGWR
jgi:hypothetical protein